MLFAALECSCPLRPVNRWGKDMLFTSRAPLNTIHKSTKGSNGGFRIFSCPTSMEVNCRFSKGHESAPFWMQHRSQQRQLSLMSPLRQRRALWSFLVGEPAKHRYISILLVFDTSRHNCFFLPPPFFLFSGFLGTFLLWGLHNGVPRVFTSVFSWPLPIIDIPRLLMFHCSQ